MPSLKSLFERSPGKNHKKNSSRTSLGSGSESPQTGHSRNFSQSTDDFANDSGYQSSLGSQRKSLDTSLVGRNPNKSSPVSSAAEFERPPRPTPLAGSHPLVNKDLPSRSENQAFETSPLKSEQHVLSSFPSPPTQTEDNVQRVQIPGAFGPEEPDEDLDTPKMQNEELPAEDVKPGIGLQTVDTSPISPTSRTFASAGQSSDTNAGQSSDINAGQSSGTCLLGHSHHLSAEEQDIANLKGGNVQHDHKYLQHVTHRNVRHLEVEEVRREKEHDRHIHHIQYHVQPVQERIVNDEVQSSVNHPLTEIAEQHVSTKEDYDHLQSLISRHQNSETDGPLQRTIVDLGERVNENVLHHVHHLTLPVVEQDIVHRTRIRTTIPIHVTIHEAPIVHTSSQHEPVVLKDFLARGGKVDSDITFSQVTDRVLKSGQCQRSVDGNAEQILRDLHIRKPLF